MSEAVALRERWVALAAACVLLSWITALPAGAQPAAGAFFVRGSVGINSLALRDWRNALDGQRQFYWSNFGYLYWRNLQSGISPGLELGYMLTDQVSVGGSVHHQRGTSDNAFSDGFDSISQLIRVSMVGVMANVTLWPPTQQGLFVGGGAGVGLGRASEDVHFVSGSGPTYDVDLISRWNGSGFIGSLFVGYQERIGSSAFGYMKGWYQLANLGLFDGTSTSPQTGSYSGPPGPPTRPFDTDFSGIGLVVGFGVAFGGQPRDPGENVINERPPGRE